ncbi:MULTISPECIES: tyrosine-type recombinase/integrase [Pseudomonas]|uniref:ICE integrase n=2 Tax=Pseudomonas TaxID=286 RepID=A0A6G6ISE4_PSENT|nr:MULTISPECIES: integrase arm-type DNA-binding domain-containing protein [Pseudomonas]KYO84067.1 putative prophage CPS-53 integrase [Pseudomonas aeruginosa]NWD82525.1 tyrosine-type recombinase/integrase [Pseudomonas reactans]NWE87070.1 tyrosine-type recombinase/integrase [Pseudomonas reactans]QIE86116.1 ICE integrase [Pseudomonas nitroreducens]HCE6398066.1 tyrosine-type recombinase/integrase [Pseudomonas aeruginosa]
MLSDLTVRQAKATGKPYTLADFDGLSLFVSANGAKAWHFRFSWGGKRDRMSFGSYPALSLKDARALRDEAHSLLAKGVNPHSERKRKRHAIVLAGEHTFKAVYEQWLAHRQLSLEAGRQTSLEQIGRVFKKDVFPVLRHLTIYDITRAHLLDIIAKVEKRGSLSVAEKLRTWFTQLFTYATVAIPNMSDNPSKDLDVVAIPLPPVEHNPFLRMHELPVMLQTLRKYRGRLNTQLGLRLLLLTGVRTGELRFATPDQFDLDRGLWIIPVARLKQRKLLTKKKRKRLTDIPPYIVPLSVQAQEIVRHLLDNFKTAQVYLIPGDWCLKKAISENTLNGALKRMGYEDQLTGHGIRATISTALNELGYPKKWVDSQLSHADPDKVSATYNHAEYVEQRRVMMQDWADRLDLFEQNQVSVASMHLTITLQGLPTIAGQAATQPPVVDLAAPQLIVTPPTADMPAAPASVQRLPAVGLPDYARPRLSEVQRERLQLLEMFEAPHNLSVADYAKLAGKSRRWITYEIQAGNLLSIHMGNRGQRVPDWQLDPLKRRLVQSVLKQLPRGIDTWDIYHALLRAYDGLGARAAIDAVSPTNLHLAARLVAAQCMDADDPTMPFEFPRQARQA